MSKKEIEIKPVTNTNYLKSIVIQNVQSHKNTEITFSPGVTVITGSSDSGKSSIMRGFKWWICNRPNRGSIKSWFATDSEIQSVKGIFSDGRIVERIRNSELNAYVIDNDSKDAKEALKTTVPKEVTDVLGLTDVSLQDQHSPYFLLQDTAGAVASKFNEVIGLDAMDECLAIANKKVASIKQAIDIHNKNYGKKRKDYKSLDWVLDVDGLIEEADTLLLQIEEIEESIQFISTSIERLENISFQIKDASEFLVYEEIINDTLIIHKDINSRNQELNELLFMINSLETLAESILECDNTIGLEADVNQAELILLNISNKKNELSDLINLIDSASKISKSRDEEISNLNSLSSELESVLSRIDICPVCDTQL